MKFSAKIEGLGDFDKALRNLNHSVNPKARNAALEVAADQVAERMRQLVPVLSGDLRESITVQSDKEGVRIGPAGDHAFRAHFTEFGTVHHGAEPFIRPAFDAEQDNVTKVISRRMQASISRSIGGA